MVMVKVVFTGDAVPQAQYGGHVLHGLVHLLTVGDLDVDQRNADAALRGALRFQPIVGSGDGDQGDAVLRAEGGAALALQDTHHGELDAVYAYGLAHRVAEAEQPFGHFGTQHGHVGTGVDVGLRYELARGHGEVTHISVFGCNAHHLTGQAISAHLYYSKGADLRSNGGDPGREDRVAQALSVFQGQGGAVAAAEEAAFACRTGPDKEQVGAQLLYARDDVLLRATPYGHKRDDGGHAYHYAEKGESGAQLVGRD